MNYEMQSQQIDALLDALSKAQSIMMGAQEDSNNPFFKSSYADLTSVWKACRQPLTSNGLSIVQTVQLLDGNSCLVSILGHTSGQWIKSILPIKTPVIEKRDKNTGEILSVTKDDLQSLGSAITYCRRYALAALVGVCPADDDAESTMQRNKSSSKEKPPIILQLSEGIDPILVQEFLVESCKGKTFTIEDLKAHAQKNMKGFIENFEVWKSKKTSQVN